MGSAKELVMSNPMSTLIAPLVANCYQAITTKYLGPTNSRGSRVKATAAAGSVTISWDDALNAQENHAMAAMALASQLGWIETPKSGPYAEASKPELFARQFAMGGIEGAACYAFVRCNTRADFMGQCFPRK